MAEGARLESVYTFTGIGGSNPSLSAIMLLVFDFAPLRSRFRHAAQFSACPEKFREAKCRMGRANASSSNPFSLRHS